MSGETKAKNAKVWERDPLDFYVEESFASRALFRAEAFDGEVWDPACGQGNIVREALGAGLTVHGTDIKRRTRESWFCGEYDFLETKWLLASNIVTNPPFFRARGTEDFIRHALSLKPRKLAVFASLPFLASQRRSGGLFQELPPTRVLILGRRPSCPSGAWLAEGNEPGGGAEDWMWVVYHPNTPSVPTQIRWLTAEQCA